MRTITQCIQENFSMKTTTYIFNLYIQTYHAFEGVFFWFQAVAAHDWMDWMNLSKNNKRRIRTLSDAN